MVLRYFARYKFPRGPPPLRGSCHLRLYHELQQLLRYDKLSMQDIRPCGQMKCLTIVRQRTNDCGALFVWLNIKLS